MSAGNSKQDSLTNKLSTERSHSGTLLPTAGLDLIRNRRDTQQIRVMEKGGSRLLASELARCGQALALPTKPVAFGTVGKLFRAIRDTLLSYFELAAGAPDLLAFIVIATWFPEHLPLAPTVVISGSPTDAQPLLRVLRCLCRHGLLVADLTPAALTGAVMQLMPTLIISHQLFSERLKCLLLASNSPGCTVLVHGEPRTTFCFKIIFNAGSELVQELVRAALRVTIYPAKRPPRLNEAVLKMIEEKFQNQLLSYRLTVREKVGRSDFDVPAFASEMRMVARTLGACVVGDPQLQASVVDLLSGQDMENQMARGSDIWCVVIEAVLFHLREGKRDKLFVQDVTTTVNQLLRCRNEHMNWSDRAIGQKLEELGFRKRRGSAGVFIPCDRAMREFVERLAREYQVLSAVVDDARSATDVRGVTATQ